MANITFDVIDLACQAADQSFFPPRVAVTTKSTTQIATVLGYPEYIPSNPPKKYKTLTWSGTSEQIATALNTGDKVGDAKYIYSGAGTIDIHGNQVANYSKDFYTPCPASNFSPVIIISAAVPTLIGYCWHLDPVSCPVCSDPPDFKQNVAANSIHDEPFGLLGVGTPFHTITPTTLTNIGQQGIICALADSGPGSVTNVPKTTLNGISAPWITLIANHNYSATLSDEYTDAEALANALVVVSNGKTAENLIRTTGFVSRFTSVVYTLSLSNLLPGSNYVVSVLFVDQSFVKSIRNYAVAATKDTATIIDVIPQPLPGNFTTLVSATAAFAP